MYCKTILELNPDEGKNLKRRVGVCDEVDKVVLEPSSGFRSGLLCVRLKEGV